MMTHTESRDLHFRKLENMFHTAPVNQMLGNRIQVAEGSSEIHWDVQPQYFHGGNALHGAFYFKLLDDAAYFAANSVERGCFLVTAEFHLHLLRPVPGGSLRAVGKLIMPGRSLYAAESFLYDAKGREVARGSGTFAVSRLALTDAAGYALPDGEA